MVALRVVTVVGWRGRWWGWHLPTRALLDMGSLMGTCRWCVLSRACWMASLVRPRCSFTAPSQSIADSRPKPRFKDGVLRKRTRVGNFLTCPSLERIAWVWIAVIPAI